MVLDLISVMITSEDPAVLIGFFKRVFGMEPTWTRGEYVGFKVGSATLILGPHGEVKGKNSMPGRIMFNLETTEVAAEFTRIKSAGAKVIADPDGNYFQLGSPVDFG